MFDKAFYINMRDRTDRRMNMKARLADLNIDAERFDAINAGLIDTRHLDFGCKKKVLNNAEIGCFLSHRDIYKMIKAEGWETTLILEDDCLFLEDYDFTVELALRDMPEDWDMLYLGQHNYDSIKIAQSIEGRTHAIKEQISGRLYKASRCWLTHAYIVRQKAVDTLIKGTEVLYASIDGVLADVQEGLNVYAIYPNIVKQDGTRSSIR